MKTGWQTSTLGDTCEMYQPKTISGKEMVPDGAYPVFGANGIIGRYYQYNHEEPQLLITCRGATCGSVNISEPFSWITGNAMVVRPKSAEIDMRFLEYLFRGGIDISKAITGAAQPQITRANLSPLQIRYPTSVAEQQRIVAILDEAFAGIATARAAAEQNRQNARSLFESHLQSVFSQRGEGWVEKPLGELATFRNGINFTKSSRGESIRILGVKNFQNSFWAPLDELETIIPDGVLSDADTLEEHDLVFVRSNGNPELIGRCLLIGAVSERITYSGFTIRARLHTQDVVPQYLCHFLKSNKARREMIDGGNGANIKSLNQGTLSRLVIPFPDTSNQVALVEQLEAVQQEAQRLEALYQRKLEALDELKQSLLHQAFSGQLLGN
ncbi:restriction endonuclease subunit S [Metapseudomonas otitidis]|uniref:restriction endonuclease subunit S n=1 Tax=Metapseudomonas otitidis TaxID=319939 RepID=UPI002541947A|nr:restriction endonuclease subunit S [Pseudomonas otitidis]WIF66885.1 restriction endonuclease subunit S [Pseudomonas otitidis]